MPNLDTGAAVAAPTDARIHALDHLRALAMLAGVLFHAALAYSPLMHAFWPTAYRASSPWVDTVVWLLHLVRMPLFFLVAGYFTTWLIERRGMTGLMQHRVRRILVPFLLAWPFVHVAMSAATRQAAHTVQNPSPFLSMLREWLAMPDPPWMPPGTGHLWFLYYLLLFTALVWIARTLGWSGLFIRLLRLGAARVALLLPLLVLPGFLLTTTPHPAPESLLPQFWAVALYGPFFALGAALHGRLDTLQPLRRWLWPMLATCLLLHLAFLFQLSRFGNEDWMRHAPWSTALLQACIAGWGTLAGLVAGLRWLARPNAWLAYLSRSAYWTYLLHLPVLFAVQYALLDVALAWPIAFLVASGITLAVCLLSYELLVRRTRLRHWVG